MHRTQPIAPNRHRLIRLRSKDALRIFDERYELAGLAALIRHENAEQQRQLSFSWCAIICCKRLLLRCDIEQN